MATVKPFKGLRPTKDFERIACPPYDVISSQEAREMAQGNPESFLHIDKPEIDLPEGTDPYSPAVYAKAQENFLRFQQEGLLTQDATPHYYLYAQTMAGRTQYGLVAAVSTLEYDKGIIRKHELTRKDKELDRSKHVQALHATTGPVFLTYPDDPDIDRTVAGVISDFPVCSFMADDGIRHTFWVISDPDDMAKIEEAFKKSRFCILPTDTTAPPPRGMWPLCCAKNIPRKGKRLLSITFWRLFSRPASCLLWTTTVW